MSSMISILWHLHSRSELEINEIIRKLAKVEVVEPRRSQRIEDKKQDIEERLKAVNAEVEKAQDVCDEAQDKLKEAQKVYDTAKRNLDDCKLNKRFVSQSLQKEKN